VLTHNKSMFVAYFGTERQTLVARLQNILVSNHPGSLDAGQLYTVFQKKFTPRTFMITV